MPSNDDLFINDDLDRSSENRLNHVLFGLFLNDDFRQSVLEHLAMPQDSVIYKPTDRSWGRPDFAIEGPNGTTAGYIEVELDQDQVQLQKYKAGAGVVPIFSLGRHSHQGHEITLEELVDMACAAAIDEPSAQLKLMVRHLQKQVYESGGARSQPTEISPPSLETPLGKALVDGGMVNWEDEPTKGPGKVYGMAYSTEGISARVFSPVAADHTVSVFFQTKGRPVICFASYEHLVRYLPNRREKLDAWADFIQEKLGENIRGLKDKERCNVDLSIIELHLEDLVAALWTLA